MRVMIMAISLLFVAPLAGADEPEPQIMCFKSGERTDGLYKTCFYRCPGGTAAISVKSYELCPLTIDR